MATICFVFLPRVMTWVLLDTWSHGSLRRPCVPLPGWSPTSFIPTAVEKGAWGFGVWPGSGTGVTGKPKKSPPFSAITVSSQV